MPVLNASLFTLEVEVLLSREAFRVLCLDLLTAEQKPQLVHESQHISKSGSFSISSFLSHFHYCQLGNLKYDD